jgi:hypothetical protein
MFMDTTIPIFAPDNPTMKLKGQKKAADKAENKRYIPSAPHKVRANGRTVSMNDHIRNEQIHGVFAVSFSCATVATTMPGDMKVYIGCYKLNLPTTDRLQEH